MSNRPIRKLRYEFKQGARYGIAADVVGSELAKIQQEHGVTTPHAVVEAGRPEDAPLHPVFEWRNEVAGEKYRVWQARNLIKAVVTIEEKNGKDESTQVYVHVPKGSAGDDELNQTPSGYQPVSVVVSRPDMYASALSELAGKVSAAKASLEALTRAAEQAPDTDQERMARIAIAVQAMQTASAAVQALH